MHNDGLDVITDWVSDHFCQQHYDSINARRFMYWYVLEQSSHLLYVIIRGPEVTFCFAQSHS